ncbi:MAG: hypothetical protein J0M12_15785 [Deltaproteobacteria bacterium]|nr:hypothetical protein [Deltaproteobacteria bacterium]
MIHLHPPLTAFPLALISVATLLEIWCMIRPSSACRAAIRINLILAAVFVVAAFFSGYWASDSANQTFIVSDETIRQHHNAGRLLLFLIFPCAALEFLSAHATHNPKLFRALYLIALVVCFGLVVYTGLLGGRLVFLEGAGVSATR